MEKRDDGTCVKVAVRIRPLNSTEIDANCGHCLGINEEEKQVSACL